VQESKLGRGERVALGVSIHLGNPQS
jgi:hypothetical protein